MKVFFFVKKNANITKNIQCEMLFFMIRSQLRLFLKKVSLAVISISVLPIRTVSAESLQILLDEAKDNSAYMAESYNDIELSNIRVKQAYSALSPNLSINSQNKWGNSYQDNLADGSSAYKTRTYNIQLVAPIYNDELYQNIKQSRKNIDVSKHQQKVTEDEIYKNIIEHYFALIELKIENYFFRDQKELVLKQKKVAQANFDAGIVSITDVRESEAKYTLLMSNSKLVELQQTREAQILSLLTNKKIILSDFKLPKNFLLPDIEEIEKNDYLETLVQNNRAFKVREDNIEIARQEIRKAKSQIYPVLNFTAKANYAYHSKDTAVSSQQNGWDTIYGLELTVPLYSFNTHYKVKESHIRLEKAKNELSITQEQIKNQFEDLFYTTLISKQKYIGLESSEISALTALEANKKAYSVGMRTNIEVLEAQSKYLDVRKERLLAWQQAWQNYLKLKLLVGNLTTTDISKIDSLIAL